MLLKDQNLYCDLGWVFIMQTRIMAEMPTKHDLINID